MPDTVVALLEEALQTEVLLDEWDEPPQLRLLISTPSNGVMKFMPLPIPGEIWERFHPYQVLNLSAEMMDTSAVPPLDIPADEITIEGLVLVNEGWALRSKTSDEEEVKRLQEYAETHSIEFHPDRIEVKMVSAVTKNGNRYLTTYERGSKDSWHVLTGHKDSPDEHLDGRIYEAMERLLASFLGKLQAS
jgi:hypothetical protein